MNPGVYMVQGEQVTTLKQGEVKMVNHKGPVRFEGDIADSHRRPANQPLRWTG